MILNKYQGDKSTQKVYSSFLITDVNIKLKIVNFLSVRSEKQLIKLMIFSATWKGIDDIFSVQILVKYFLFFTKA